MRAKRKKSPIKSQESEGAQMSNELEGARAMVVNLGLLEPMVLATSTMRLV